MFAVRNRTAALYVDKLEQQWIVRDPEGNYWIVPCVENARDHREPYRPAGDKMLNPVPGHYKSMLGLPF